MFGNYKFQTYNEDFIKVLQVIAPCKKNTVVTSVIYNPMSPPCLVKNDRLAKNQPFVSNDLSSTLINFCPWRDMPMDIKKYFSLKINSRT